MYVTEPLFRAVRANECQGEMSVDPAPKVYLQNRLSKCRSKLQELDPVLSAKRKCGAPL